MFNKSAKYYDALYSFKDYVGAAAELHGLIQQLNPGAKILLDVACGTGKHLEYLQQFYEVEGVDLNSTFLEMARQRCPRSAFYQADMAELNLGRSYDVVTCLFSSIGYVKYVEKLDKSIAAMARHLTPGGLLVIEPWFSPETYWVGRLTANFVNEPELKIAWMYTSDVDGAVSIFNINYMIGTAQGVEHFVERHELGLFTHEEYLGAFLNAGLKVQYDSKGLFGRGMYIGRVE